MWFLQLLAVYFIIGAFIGLVTIVAYFVSDKKTRAITFFAVDDSQEEIEYCQTHTKYLLVLLFFFTVVTWLPSLLRTSNTNE